MPCKIMSIVVLVMIKICISSHVVIYLPIVIIMIVIMVMWVVLMEGKLYKLVNQYFNLLNYRI
jgi:hypothetical protein